MNSILQRAAYSALVLSLSYAGAVSAALDSDSNSWLDALDAQPELAGELIYRGTTYALAEPDGQSLFAYERRVLSTPTSMTATHLTRDPSGELLIAEAAQLSADYQLQRFTTDNRQSGFSGEVAVSADGRQLRYSLNDQGELSRAEEPISAPAVTGPSMHGFILAHLDELQAGHELPIRFVVLREKQTYGFVIRHEQTRKGQSTFSITPSNWLVRWFIAPLKVVFDSQRKTVLNYEGRVPPQQNVDGKLRDLDARVEYVSVAATYR